MQGSVDGSNSLSPEVCNDTLARKGVVLMYQLYWQTFMDYCSSQGIDNYGAGKGLALERVGNIIFLTIVTILNIYGLLDRNIKQY